LATIDGVSDIETDVAGRMCSFKVKPDVDYKLRLAELAEDDDSHLADYEIQ
jgi:hypothetical protein